MQSVTVKNDSVYRRHHVAQMWFFFVNVVDLKNADQKKYTWIFQRKRKQTQPQWNSREYEILNQKKKRLKIKQGKKKNRNSVFRKKRTENDEKILKHFYIEQKSNSSKEICKITPALCTVNVAFAMIGTKNGTERMVSVFFLWMYRWVKQRMCHFFFI